MVKSICPDFLKGRQVYLASRSPRRQELLRYITEDFRVEVSHFDEEPLMATSSSMTPEQLVERLSAGKASAVLQNLEPSENILVIGGDTVVVSPDGEIFGIPRDEEDAARMLRSLSGRPHRVVTGMTICSTGRNISFSVSTDVEFYPLSEQEIADYLATGEPFDKAGAYGIQGYGSMLVREIHGNYENVVGLPVAVLCRKLRDFCQK
ncbi:MAG: Maf family protein [Candidatus Merdivicinus sp.]|jgi:septum formation protein